MHLKISDKILQYGQYHGQSFDWVLLNDPSYIIYLGVDFSDKASETLKSDEEKILFSLVSYAMTFPLFNQAYSMHKNPVSRQNHFFWTK